MWLVQRRKKDTNERTNERQCRTACRSSRRKRGMSESLLSSSGESLDSSPSENVSTTLESYSLLFDKNKHNFSTSSEVSFRKSDRVSPPHDRTVTERGTDFNPFLLLFLPNDPLDTNETQIADPICLKTSLPDDSQVNECASAGQGSLPVKTVTHYQHNHAKRNSLIRRRTKRCSDDGDNADDDDDQAFEKFLQEHRTVKPVVQETKSPIQPRRKNRNSLKEFICDSSSSSEEDPSEFYPKVNRLIDKDLSWRQDDDDDDDEDSTDQSGSSASSSSSPSSSSESDSRPVTKKRATKLSVTFLESLSHYVPLDDKHVDAKPYFTRSGFTNKVKRQELADKLFSIYDKDVFSSKLSEKVTIVWSGRLTATAGHCTTRRNTSTATITLSHKVCDSPERCRDTLLHELCHAAVSLIDGVRNEGHGPLWRKWTRAAERCYQYLPAISVKHTYEIAYKFVYCCTKCQYEVHRHSKSLNVEVDFCGKCLGKFELLFNNTKKNEMQTPKRTLTRYNLFVKEHFQTMKQAQPHLSTPQLMKHLSQEYKKTMQQQPIPIDLPDLEQLKI